MADKIERGAEKLSPVQKLAKIDEERARLDKDREETLLSAKSDALQKVSEAVDELNALGFHFHLSEEAPRTNGTKRGEPNGPCPTCNFATDPPHDLRSHRTQTPKAPFTDEELAKRHLVKVP